MFRIHDGTQPVGERVDESTLKKWIEEGRISADSLVLRDGDAKPMPVRDLRLGRSPAPSPSSPLSTPPPLGGSAPAAAVAGAPKRTSRLAIASLICGILALPTIGVSALVGLGLGIAALVSIGRNRLTMKGELQAIIGLVLSGVFLVSIPVLAGLLLPALARAKYRAGQIHCINNMKQIALGIRIYANDHKELYPPNINSLSNELSTPKVLICPLDKSRTSLESTITWSDLRPEHSSYDFLTPGASENKLGSDTVILRCSICGHEAYSDGSVHREQRK